MSTSHRRHDRVTCAPQHKYYRSTAAVGAHVTRSQAARIARGVIGRVNALRLTALPPMVVRIDVPEGLPQLHRRCDLTAIFAPTWDVVGDCSLRKRPATAISAGGSKVHGRVEVTAGSANIAAGGVVLPARRAA